MGVFERETLFSFFLTWSSLEMILLTDTKSSTLWLSFLKAFWCLNLNHLLHNPFFINIGHLPVLPFQQNILKK
jgi:hypothetical protein